MYVYFIEIGAIQISKKKLSQKLAIYNSCYIFAVTEFDLHKVL